MKSRFFALPSLALAAGLLVAGVSPVSADAAVKAPALKCTVGKAVASLPFKASPKDPGNLFYDFEAFTTNRNGTYAGIAYRSASSDFYLLTRAPGKKPTVLRKVHYPYAHATPNAVNAIGFTPQMNLVVALQNTNYKPGRVAFGSYKGIYYTGRIAHYLQGSKSWISYMPTAVASNGRISGWAATGTPTNPHYYVVTWASVTSKPVALAYVGGVHPSVQMTGNGDMGWQGANGYTVVRKADGSTHELDFGSHAASSGIFLAGASQNSFYVAGNNGVFRWVISTGKLPAGAAIQGSRLTTGSAVSSWVDSVGASGSTVLGSRTAVFRLADGRRVPMPAQALPAAAQARSLMGNGVVAFTAKGDRKVHFLSCK